MARWATGLLLLAGVGLAVPVRAADQTDRPSHVRATDPAVQALLDWGLARSATLASLVETLNRSDVIVYVQEGTLPTGVGGMLLHRIVSPGGRRYVRIVVSLRGARDRLTGVIAHELQHAAELAQAPEVLHHDDVTALFKRIGFPADCQRTCSETAAALDVQARVVDEVRRESPVGRAPRAVNEHRSGGRPAVM
jgi:hypothetical protein